MSEALITPAPDFDQPIAVLKHCHDRIRKQLQTLERLQERLAQPNSSADTPGVDVKQAAGAILRYFRQAAPQHHADEEDDLLPVLKSCASGADAAQLQALLPEVLDEHRQMEQCWALLEPQLQALADGQGSTLDEQAARRFTSLYTQHMEKEEGTIAPMAKRLFSAQQMETLGNAMRARRGIPCGGDNVDR